MRLPPRRGVTLAEILVATLLLGIIGVVVILLLRGAISSSDVGKLHTQMQQNVRLVLDRVSSEMRQASVLPQPRADASSIPSAALWPECYLRASDSSGIQEKSNNKGDDTVDATDPTSNRVLFTEAKGDISRPDFNFADFTNYRYVLYSMDRTGPRPRLIRRVYLVQGGSGMVGGLNYTTTWDIDWSYFNSPANLDPEYHPTGDPSVILELPQSLDTLILTVSRRRLPSKDFRFNVDFDRNLLKVKARLTEYLHGDSTRPRTLEMETQVQVKGS